MAEYNPPEVDIQLLVTDENLNILGDPIIDWVNVDGTVRFNRPGSGYALLPAYDDVRELITAGNRVVLLRNGRIFNSGPIEQYRYIKSDDGQETGTGVIHLNWVDDLVWLAARVTYPDPAAAVGSQTDDRWTYDGNAETAIRNLVDQNAGPSALAARQVPQLALGSVVGVGSTITVSTRLQPLLEEVRAIATAGGGLGVRTRQDNGSILFEVYQPADLSGDIRFGFGLGNARYLELDVKGPTATALVVAGEGEGADRTLMERVNTAGVSAWGRLEELLDRRGSDTVAELEQDGDEQLVEAAETVRLASNVYDTEDQRFGEDFNLGDKVSLEVWPGKEINDLVRTVHLAATPTSGEIVTIYVGSHAQSPDPQWVRRMRKLDRELAYLSANAEVPTA